MDAATPNKPHRGRGAVSNRVSRFAKHQRTPGQHDHPAPSEGAEGDFLRVADGALSGPGIKGPQPAETMPRRATERPRFRLADAWQWADREFDRATVHACRSAAWARDTLRELGANDQPISHCAASRRTNDARSVNHTARRHIRSTGQDNEDACTQPSKR